MSEKKKILIAEDEKAISKAMELKLYDAGFEVLPVFDGQQALDEIERNNYDLVILDLMMPNMNGFNFLSQLKEKEKNTPVIITSNLGQKEDIEKAKKMGAVGYFVKSDTPLTEIVAFVKKYFNSQQEEK